MKRITITEKQVADFNRMAATLRIISKDYQTPEQLRRNCEKQYGLKYEEALEMSYENIQDMASSTVKGVKHIIIN